MQKLQLFLCVVAVGLLLYLCSKPECGESKKIPPPPPNAPPEIKEVHAIEEVKNAQKEAQVAQVQAAVASEKVKDAVMKLQNVRKESLYTPY